MVTLERLSSQLGIELHMKRDDLTGSHLSGNKIRKLDFLLADAMELDATHVITCGGLQSNHARATALAAVQLGLSPVLLLRTANGRESDLPNPPTANVLLDRLSGARIETCTPVDYRERRNQLMDELAHDLKMHGGRPYVIPEGGSNALGALGYVACAREILAQLEEPPDAVVVATGSGGTLAGLALGFEDAGVHTRAIGVAVCDDAAYFETVVDRIADDAHRIHGLPVLSPGRYTVLEGFQGRGYGLTTDPELAFLTERVRKDGIALDPVYTNKAMLGLVTTLRNDPTAFGRRVVFIHTGGIFGLFAHADHLAAVAE